MLSYPEGETYLIVGTCDTKSCESWNEVLRAYVKGHPDSSTHIHALSSPHHVCRPHNPSRRSLMTSSLVSWGVVPIRGMGSGLGTYQLSYPVRFPLGFCLCRQYSRVPVCGQYGRGPRVHDVPLSPSPIHPGTLLHDGNAICCLAVMVSATRSGKMATC